MVNTQLPSPPSQNENTPQPDDPVIKTTTPSGDGSNLNGNGNNNPTTTPPTNGSNPGVDITINTDDGIVFTNIFGNHPYMRQDKQKSLGVHSHLKFISRELLLVLFTNY